MNRYETNLKTIEYVGYTDVGIADGENYPDALAATGLLKEKNMGIIIVDGSDKYTVPDNLNVNYTFGGSVKNTKGEVIKGDDRYDTAIEIAKKSTYKNMSLVSGDNFADALSATNIVNSKNTYIVLAPKANKTELQNLDGKIDNVYVIGGVKSISNREVSDTIDMVNGLYTESIELIIDFPKIITSDELTFTIVNNSNNEIQFGGHFKLSRVLENGSLEIVKTKPGTGWNGMAYIIGPKQKRKFTVSLFSHLYKKGEHVFEKEIEVNGKSILIQDKFIIE